MQIIGDFTTSVVKALEEIDPHWDRLSGLIVCGSHDQLNFTLEETLEKIKRARLDDEPFLGICFGMQLACIEFARNVFDLYGANTEELDPNAEHRVITRLPARRAGQKPVDGWWGATNESHWHEYYLNEDYHHLFDPIFNISYTEEDGRKIAEYMELPRRPHFVLTQFHPEYQNLKEKPHPVLQRFIDSCR